MLYIHAWVFLYIYSLGRHGVLTYLGVGEEMGAETREVLRLVTKTAISVAKKLTDT